MIKTCIICGKEFDAYCSTAKVCSDACRKKKDRENGRRTYQKKYGDKFNDWLTIPDAPNYEINSALQVRNKKTGKLLKPQNHALSREIFYRPFGAEKQLFKTAVMFRRQAEAAVSTQEWYPVPSLDNLYEFNQQNLLRNSLTKRQLTRLKNQNAYCVWRNGHRLTVNIASLRWEIFGELPSRESKILRPIIISKNKTTLYYNNHKSAAKTIAVTSCYAVGTIANLLVARQPEIFGWHINYLEDEITEIAPYLKGMQKKDPRPK